MEALRSFLRSGPKFTLFCGAVTLPPHPHLVSPYRPDPCCPDDREAPL